MIELLNQLILKVIWMFNTRKKKTLNLKILSWYNGMRWFKLFTPIETFDGCETATTCERKPPRVTSLALWNIWSHPHHMRPGHSWWEECFLILFCLFVTHISVYSWLKRDVFGHSNGDCTSKHKHMQSCWIRTQLPTGNLNYVINYRGLEVGNNPFPCDYWWID